MSKEKSKSKYSNKKEIGRFVVVGIIATIISFVVYNVTTLIMKKCGIDGKSLGITVTATATSFILSVIVNYILSNTWVYKNVDKKEMDKHKKRNFIVFVILSAIGMGISMGVMSLCKFTFIQTMNINIEDWYDVGVEPLKNLGLWISKVITSGRFWLYAFSYVLNAICGLTFNYISRKKILYKEPKKNGNN